MSPQDRRAEIALATLRGSLIAVILVSEKLVDARRLSGSAFFVVLAVASLYALSAIVTVHLGSGGSWHAAFARAQPNLDILLLTSLTYTSGGAFSDARKAFFVIPLAAAFSERPAFTARWSVVAVGAFTAQAMLFGGHPAGAQNGWQRVTINQDLYLAWTGAAATLLAAGLARRSAETEALARSRGRLVTLAIDAVEQERTRLAGALHDSPVQNLIAARHDLRRAQRNHSPESFDRLHDALDTTIGELREEIFRLHPHVLDHVGLGAALDQVARRHIGETDTHIVVEIDPAADATHRQILFALGRELLGNAAKHAAAASVRLRVSVGGGNVRLEVTDDGCGIPDGRVEAALMQGHIGLASVRERVTALGGQLRIDTAPSHGTHVQITLPLHGDNPRTIGDTSDRVTPLDLLRVSTA